MPQLSRVGVRSSLAPRREPYWQHLVRGGYLGFRRGPETWVARWRDADTGARSYKKLGRIDYPQAKVEAEEWFKSCGVGVTKAGTVEEAVNQYIANRQAMRGGDAADRDRVMFKQVLFGTRLAAIKLDRLKADDIEEWRNGLVSAERSKATANRIYRSLRAAFNYAFRKRLISSQPWEAVEAFPVREGSRQTYLTLADRRALLEASGPELRTFLTALMYTAARPGEMERATVRDLDLNTGTLRLVSSKGKGGQERPRNFPLSGESLAFFKRCAEGKAKGDLLAAAPGWSRTQWSRALRKVKNGIVCYDLRHTTISDWLMNGVDIGTVAKLAGTSVVMIDKNYHKFIKTQVQDKLATIAVI